MSEPRPAASRDPLVWDLPLRLFHWSVAGLVAGCWVTQELGSRWMELHMWLGYGVATLLVFRLGWGFLGTRHARFADFVSGPGAVLRYLRDWLAGESRPWTGHDPAGGWWALVLMVLLAAQAGTGMLNSDDALHAGPWHYAVPESVARAAGALHGRLFDWLILAVVIHVAAVLAHLVRPGVDLVAPMITGRKPWAPGGIPGSALWRALVVFAVAAGLVTLLVVLAPEPDPADFGIF